MKRMKVGVIGATGMVGQNYLRLLKNHPWFDVKYVAASPRSAGKRYEEAVAGRWLMAEPIPEQIRGLVVEDANAVGSAKGKCDLVFSAVELEKDAIRKLEEAYAAAGIPVVSNNSAHRSTPDVPMIIPEVNPGHIELIDTQREKRGWGKGLIAVKPNCSIQSYVTPMFALIEAGYKIEAVIVSTMQAVSGAGYPGPASMKMIDNVVPYIGGEEEKSEQEPLRILGKLKNGRIILEKTIKIAAHCNRVAVIDGHMACVSLKFKGAKPSLDEVKKLWINFAGEPQKLNLPTAPKEAIIYREEPDRPQPRMDRDAWGAMAVSVGRLRECPVFDLRFVGLSHNTVRGAAGGAILSAELLKAKGYL
ncbi:MAG: aspartate-semialdehyde dehydrogenase [Deltaproteobacteria bacterium]|nr:aspartate-semialdehyde dehydrogenase [Deltaproteobacteria bacterium]